MAGFEDLIAWQKAVNLSVAIYKETRDIKDFGFRDQITRAGLSIPSNIAEGMERTTAPDQCKFLDYARASCGEVRTQAIVGQRVGFITNSAAENWCASTREIAAMLNGLIRSIRSKNT